MVERLMGVETEYALTALGPGGRSLPRDPLVREFLKIARDRLVHLADGGAGVFLRNAGRLYVDAGFHPELSTPECTDPRDVVRYAKAGDRIVRDLAEALESEQRGVREVMLFRGNVDYLSGATWGHHESYLFRAGPDSRLSEQILPHLVSRIVFAGAGGFDPRSPGLRFTLSARAPHLREVVSCSSTHDRGIIHTKDEPLSGHGWRRFHLLCGDSLCSELAEWLSVGSTSLVIALAEAGARPGDSVALSDPLGALRSFAADPRCRAEAGLKRGGSATAIAIERHYLEQVEAHLRGGRLPSWAAEVCRTWREILDRLDRDPEQLSTTLDWVIKRRLYAQRGERRGFPPERVEAWTEALESLTPAIPNAVPDPIVATFPVPVDPGSELDARMRGMDPALERPGLSREQLGDFLAFRREMLEIDTRFAQMGTHGIFEALDGAGVLTHRVTSDDEIERALTEPPAGTRAQLRGRLISENARRKTKVMVTWQSVWDLEAQRVLDLSDPFETEEKWTPCEGEPPHRIRRPDALLRFLVDLGL